MKEKESTVGVRDNLSLYEQGRAVPDEAQKQFNNGKFRGTDINPMWRIKMLTQMFGPCGIGWVCQITKQWLETAPDGTVKAFVNADLKVKMDGEWSQPISGTGGSTFVTKTKAGYLDISDECYKMAYTDAISVCCKMLGIGADIYFANDRTKYTNAGTQEEQRKQYETNLNTLLGYVKACNTIAEIASVYNNNKAYQEESRFVQACTERKNEINASAA